MGRVTPAQLAWISRNRRWRERGRPLGELLAGLDVEKADGDRRARAVFEAINVVVDEGFRRCCRLDEVRGDEVVILVETGHSLYHIRTRWHAELREHLQRCLPQRKIRKITFRAGSGGAEFSQPKF